MKRILQKHITPCGMNCAICKGYLRAKDPCPGCRVQLATKTKARLHCTILKCDKRQGRFCYDCAKFPCRRLKDLDKRYRTKYAMSEIANLEYIRDHGIAEFVAEEQCRWVSPEGILCVHDRKRYPASTETGL